MKVRITFRSELFVQGEDLAEVVSKFESMPLFSADALEEGSAEYIELVSMDDEETGDDLMHQYNKITEKRRNEYEQVTAFTR